MIEPEVLEAIREGLAGALVPVEDVRVVVGQPGRPLAKDDTEIRVVVEDAGSFDDESIDGAPFYNAEVEVQVSTYRSASIAAETRGRVQQWMRGFRLRGDRHSGSWRSSGGWDIADDGEHRFAGCVWSARVYSRFTLLDRLNVRHGSGQPLNLELEVSP